MNRQIRRAQEKQDRKADKERDKRREARRDKVQKLRDQRARSREAIKKRREGEVAAKAAGDSSDGGAEDAGAAGTKSGGSTAGGTAERAAAGGRASKGRKPGRFSGALMMATVFFIVLQSAVPAEDPGPDTLRTITSAGFYLLFGYFSTLWLMRRATPRPLTMTMISGVMLTVGVEVAKRFQPEVTTDLLLLALAIPAIAAGAFLGRLVYTNTPA